MIDHSWMLMYIYDLWMSMSYLYVCLKTRWLLENECRCPNTIKNILDNPWVNTHTQPPGIGGPTHHFPGGRSSSSSRTSRPRMEALESHGRIEQIGGSHVVLRCFKIVQAFDLGDPQWTNTDIFLHLRLLRICRHPISVQGDHMGWSRRNRGTGCCFPGVMALRLAYLV